MNEIYVPSLELCKQLKEVGFPQDTEFYYVTDEISKPKFNRFVDKGEADNWDRGYVYSAPLTDELLKELPSNLEIKKFECWLEIIKLKSDYLVNYSCKDGRVASTIDESLPNALSKTYTYLKKEKLI